MSDPESVIHRPRLLVNFARVAARGAWEATRNDGELTWLVAMDRLRSVVPGVATGVVWQGANAFTDALEPLLDQSTRALELGSGGGRIARLVAPLVRELVCTDISATMLEEAQANLGRHPNVTFARTKPYKLDEFGDASFDVFAHDVFMDFDANQTVALLGEARRILVDGGMCVASFITIDRPEWGARHPRTCEGREGTSERR